MRRLGLWLVCLLFVSGLGALRAVARQKASALKKPDKATLVRLDNSLPDLMAKVLFPDFRLL